MYSKQDFYFDLPEELIAQTPLPVRSSSRLLVLDGEGGVADKKFNDLLDFVQPNDLLVFNNTKVVPARLFGKKASGGKIEVLFERLAQGQQAWCHVRSNKAPRVGVVLHLADNAFQAKVVERDGGLFLLEFAAEKTPLEWLEIYGHMPLPPYISRDDSLEDRERYQTVYAENLGAVAAPTAGLHFDKAMLQSLEDARVGVGFVTLHVGAGTFKPVQVEDISQHKMHSESFEVKQDLVDKIAAARARGGRVIAVGTTSVRCLETAGQSGELQALAGDTDIFITPGYDFKQVDILLTNFHLPESTLIMLVSAFNGFESTMKAYDYAVQQGYRFFSYGDAMLVFKKNEDGI